MSNSRASIEQYRRKMFLRSLKKSSKAQYIRAKKAALTSLNATKAYKNYVKQRAILPTLYQIMTRASVVQNANHYLFFIRKVRPKLSERFFRNLPTPLASLTAQTLETTSSFIDTDMDNTSFTSSTANTTSEEQVGQKIVGIPCSELMQKAEERMVFDSVWGARSALLNIPYVLGQTNVIENTYERACLRNFDPIEWVKQNLSDWTSQGKGIFIGLWKTCKIQFSCKQRDMLVEFECMGNHQLVAEFEKFLESQDCFQPLPVTISWAQMTPQGVQYSQSRMNKKPRIEGSFPWVPGDVDKYIDEYLNSEASVLLLLGTPGTGKTSLIREISFKLNTEVTLTYDTELLKSDQFFSNFLSDDDTEILVIEDADNLMGFRTQGNTAMQRFLNISDGLVSVPNKKIILTANLPSVRDIDPAFLRKGRCFDVLTSRPLTFEEAQVVCNNFYKNGGAPQLENRPYTLAEVLNPRDHSSAPARGAGFHS